MATPFEPSDPLAWGLAEAGLIALAVGVPAIVARAARRVARHDRVAAHVQWFTLLMLLPLPVLLAGLALGWTSDVPRLLAGRLISPLGPLGLLPQIVIGLVPFVVVLIAVQRFGRTLLETIHDAPPGSDTATGALLGLLATLAVGPALTLSAFASGHARVAILAAVATLGALVFTLLRFHRRSGFEPRAVTHGPLRDDVEALAVRSGIPLRELMVIPGTPFMRYNAFAQSGGRVLVTEGLLERFDRAEVRAIIAHELTHLRRDHPRRLTFIPTLVATCALLFGMFGMVAWAPAWAVLAVMTTQLWLSRRFEYEADRGAVEISGDPVALATGLSRLRALSLLPAEWPMPLRWVVTHPSTLDRVRAIVRHGGLDAASVDALAGDPPAARNGYDVATGPGEAKRAFDSAWKSSRLLRTGWAVIGVSGLVSAVAVAVAGHLGLSGLLVCVVAALVNAVAAVGLVAVLGWRAHRSLARLVRERLGPPAEATLVGFAPGASLRTFEGHPDWDVGWLRITNDGLEFHGELVTFTLPRAAVRAIREIDGFPDWIRRTRIAVDWLDASGAADDTFTLRPLEAPHAFAGEAATRELAEALRRWCALDGGQPAARVRGALPRGESVSGIPIHDVLKAPAVVLSLLLLALAAAAGCVVLGLPLVSGGRPGAPEAILAALIGYLLALVPAMRAKRVPVPMRGDAVERRAA